ncbi:MAG: RpiB/LacA/LacB family sugar-phosphate isomerase, partial [Rhodothermales bacterium]
MRIAVSTDEKTALVDEIVDELKKRGHDVLYFGPTSGDASADWPAVTLEAVKSVKSDAADE